MIPPNPFIGGTEVPESEAEGVVAETYTRIRQILGVPFVPTIYRMLAVDPFSLEIAWFAAEPVVLAALDSGIDENLRQCARTSILTQEGRVEPILSDLATEISTNIVSVIARYRAANPLNLIASLAVLGHDAPTNPGVMESPLPMRGPTVLEDIRTCHGDIVTPGLWRELKDWPLVQSRLWAKVRDAGSAGHIAQGRDEVLRAARQFVERMTTVSPTKLDERAQPFCTRVLEWFPAGVSSMIVEGELLALLTREV